MVAEERQTKGPDFTKRQRKRLVEEAHHRCQGCGRELPQRDNDNQGRPALEVHHIQPKSKGGWNFDDNAAVLCNPHGCHHDADELAGRYNISFAEVTARFGNEPFKQYRRRTVRRSRKRSPARQVVRRLRAS